MTASNIKFLLLSGVAFGVWIVVSHRGAGAESVSATRARTDAIVESTKAFLTSLNAAQRGRIAFPFAPQKTASAATFARNGMGRGPGGGDGRRQDPGRPGGPGGSHQGPGGGPGAGFGGFVGEQYGKAVWSNFPVSDVPRPGLNLGSLNLAQREAAMHLLQVVLSAKGYQKILEIMGSDQALSEAGTPFSSGIDAYTLGVFGKPSAATPWMLQYGGHHLALNIAVMALSRLP